MAMGALGGPGRSQHRNLRTLGPVLSPYRCMGHSFVHVAAPANRLPVNPSGCRLLSKTINNKQNKQDIDLYDRSTVPILYR